MLYTVRALWYIENGKKTTFYMNAVRKGIIICSFYLPLLSGEFSNILIRIKECDQIFMNGLPLDNSDSRISIHIEQA